MLGRDRSKIWAKMENTSFSRAFEGNMSKWSLNGCKALNYIFLDQKLPSVIKISVKKCYIGGWTEKLVK